MNLFEQVANAVQNALHVAPAPQGADLPALRATFGAWEPVATGRNTCLYRDNTLNNKYALDVHLCDLHYESALGSGNYDTPVNMTVTPVNLPTLNGWLANVAGYHFALGQPGGKVTDGWVGYGGRKGAHWLLHRLVRAGYLHWPSRTWDDISGVPNYNRANLTLDPASALTLPTTGAQYTVAQQATWAQVWTTPGGGRLNIQWRIDGGRLKENIILNAAARAWIANNRPPTTPLNETFFGFVFQLDTVGVHQFLKNGVWQDMTGDWEDEGLYGVEMQNQLGQLIGFLPVGHAYVVNASGDTLAVVGLRRRFWLDPDGNVYLLLGLRCDQIAGLPAGVLVFDPTIDQRVTGSADDAEELANGTSFSSVTTTLEARSSTNSATRKNMGVHFSITGPVHGDTVDVCYVYTRCASTARDSVHCDIYAHDVDNSGDFASDADVTSRTLTTALVAYNADNLGTGTVNTPSLVTPVQEVMDRAGWNGASLTLLFMGRNDTSQPGERWTPDSYDGAPATAPGLHLEYTAAVIPGAGAGLPLRGVGI